MLYVSLTSTSANVVTPVSTQRRRESKSRLLAGATPLLAALLVACAPKPEARTVQDFTDDGLARDGVLARCNRDRDATSNDVECVNARRAAAAIALQAERARTAQLEQGSDATMLALRERQQTPSFDVYANGSDAFARPALEIEARPPPNDLVIATPNIEMTDLTAVPRPFRAAAAE